MNRKHSLRDHPMVKCPKNTDRQRNTSFRNVIPTNLQLSNFIEITL